MDSYAETLRELGRRARALRQLHELTQAELARRAAVGVMTVQRFERHGRSSLENALRIATVLGVEGGFGALFAPPPYRTLDEALARPSTASRQRVRRPR